MQIKRKYLRHGDVVEIPLRNGEYVYAKIVDPRKITNPIELPFFLRIYNSISKTQIQDLKQLNRELLLAPFYIVGGSAAITKFHWRIIVNENVEVHEEWIPDTKRQWPILTDKPERWTYLERFSTHFIFSDYDNVKHLDDSSGKAIEVIPFIIELEVLKLEGKDIKVELGLKDLFEESVYKTFIDLPSFIQLPPNMKGKAIR